MPIRAGSHGARNPCAESAHVCERRITMANLFQSLRWVHIAAGSIALILFWIPAIAPKGGRTHIRAGWAYVVCMSAVVLTAFAMSGLAFTIPVAVRQIARPLSSEELSSFLREQRA